MFKRGIAYIEPKVLKVLTLAVTIKTPKMLDFLREVDLR
jgi:hypothetical protein